MQNLYNIIIDYLTITKEFIIKDNSGPILLILFLTFIFILTLYALLFDVCSFIDRYIDRIHLLLPNVKWLKPHLLHIKKKNGDYNPNLILINDSIAFISRIYPINTYYLYFNNFLYTTVLIDCYDDLLIYIEYYEGFIGYKCNVLIPKLNEYKYGIKVQKLEYTLIDMLIIDDDHKES